MPFRAHPPAFQINFLAFSGDLPLQYSFAKGRAPFLGAWMNFVLTFFTYDTMAAMMDTMFGADGLLQSPFWFTADGAVAGLVIGFFATRFGGEGKETVGN